MSIVRPSIHLVFIKMQIFHQLHRKNFINILGFISVTQSTTPGGEIIVQNGYG